MTNCSDMRDTEIIGHHTLWCFLESIARPTQAGRDQQSRLGDVSAGVKQARRETEAREGAVAPRPSALRRGGPRRPRAHSSVRGGAPALREGLWLL